MLEAVAAALSGTAFAGWAAGEIYPFANVAHVLGLALLLGAIGILDLRRLGAMQALPLEPLSAALTPLAVGGLLLMLLSGTILFAADAPALAQSATFGWKLLLLALGVANALVFRLLWPDEASLPIAARALAALSLCLWVAVAVLGRWIAYA